MRQFVPSDLWLATMLRITGRAPPLKSFWTRENQGNKVPAMGTFLPRGAVE